MLKKEDLDQYDYVILNSGDGLIHEAINECPHKKIGYLAGGTSNCILYNMLLENDFDYTE
jgi:diacylglycerol kinase family enzyme